MADRPLESELMMTAYSQLGQDLSDHISHLDAFVPSGIEENDLGFDIQIPYLKGLVFQFKRPKPDDPRRFTLRYSEQRPPRQLDNMRNWETKYGPSAAFYALPLVVDHDDLGKTLQKTAFVPASEFDSWASVARVPADYIEQGERVQDEPVDIYCSDPYDTSDSYTDSIDHSKVMGWKDLKEGIKDCPVGFRMRWQDDPYTNQYHDDHVWYPDSERDWDYEDMEFDNLFIGRQGPTLTRIGAEEEFNW